MDQPLRSHPTRGVLTAAFLCCVLLTTAYAQVPVGPAHSYDDLMLRLERQEQELAQIRQQLQQQSTVQQGQAVWKNDNCGCGYEIWRLPVVVETVPPCGATQEDIKPHVMEFETVYDNGFLIRAFNEDENPFSLRINGRIQFRYVGFDRDVDSWTDNAGITRPVRNQNNFEIERARLALSGHAFHPRLTYFLQIDGDTDDSHQLELFDYWWAWEFGELSDFQMGKRKVPAVRQWLLSSSNTRLIDRPMSADFFRPDRSVGLFSIGKLTERIHYQAMLGNGFRAANLAPDQLDNRLTMAGTSYWDPFGDFGDQIVDYDNTAQLLARFGSSFVYSPQGDADLGAPVGEADYLRLTDGTRLTELGALGPGVTVLEYTLWFYGVDLAAKWRGWSVDAEVFLRWIEDIEGNGPLEVTDLFQRGFYVEGGRFLIPSKLDVNVRYSQIDGLFGHAWTYAGGINWYPGDTSRIKISIDATRIHNSPLNNSSSNILVGYDGMLYRTQFEARF